MLTETFFGSWFFWFYDGATLRVVKGESNSWLSLFFGWLVVWLQPPAGWRPQGELGPDRVGLEAPLLLPYKGLQCPPVWVTIMLVGLMILMILRDHGRPILLAY